jgi:hypothetical protein
MLWYDIMTKTTSKRKHVFGADSFGGLEARPLFQEAERQAVKACFVSWQRMVLAFWNTKAWPQWHTYFNTATPPNPSQTILPTGTKHLNICADVEHSHPNQNRAYINECTLLIKLVLFNIFLRFWYIIYHQKVSFKLQSTFSYVHLTQFVLPRMDFDVFSE